MFEHQVVTTRNVAQQIVRHVQRLIAVRRLARIERDLDLFRKQRDAIHYAESYLQRQAMFLRADLTKISNNMESSRA